MTVKLLTAYRPYSPGNLFTSDSATEAALIAAGIATATLTGGTAYVPPPASQRSGARARTSVQLAGTPSPMDVSLDGEFYLDTDPTQVYVINAAGTAYVASGGGGGAVSSVAGKTGAVTLASTDLSDGTALNTSLNNKLALPTTNYNAATNTPAITQGQPLTVTGTRVFSVLVTVGSTSSAGPFATVNQGDTLADDGTGTWHRVAGVSSSGAIQKSDGQNPAGLKDCALGIDYGAPITLQCGVEVYRAPSGTMANNGAVTLGTALPSVLSDGCWMEFPAGAIATGIPSSAQVTAGVKWWTVMSSTTVGQVFNNTYTPGTTLPTAIPASPTAFVTTGPGAYVNGTGATPFYVITVPANTMGPNGSIDTELWASSNNSAGAKTVTMQFGGSGQGTSTSMTTGVQAAILGNVMNKGSTQRQKSSQGGKSFNGNNSKSTSSVNTTISQNLVINANTAVAGDYVCIESLRVTITGAP